MREAIDLVSACQYHKGYILPHLLFEPCLLIQKRVGREMY